MNYLQAIMTMIIFFIIMGIMFLVGRAKATNEKKKMNKRLAPQRRIDGRALRDPWSSNLQDAKHFTKNDRKARYEI